jgi:hypothetical protein
MKLLFSSLLLSFAAAEQERGLQEIYPNAGDLFTRWDMTEPDIDYDDATDEFTFRFNQASSDNYDDGLEESFWNPDCMAAEFGVTDVPIDVPLIQSIGDPNTLPELTMVGGKPEMKFKIDAAEFSTGGLPGTYSVTAGTSTIDFCIRSSLGYTLTPGAALPSNYQEVNFIETLVKIEYDMTSGFSVEAFSVAPKDRELTTISESYEDSLFAYLCKGPQHPEYNGGVGTTETINLSDGQSYVRPKAVTEYNLIDDATWIDPSMGVTCAMINSYFASNPATTVCTDNPDAAGAAAACKACGGGITNPTGSKFNQGALINVCVVVKDEFAAQGIALKELTDFTWTRTGGTTYDSAIGGGSGTNTIDQVAIVNSASAGNYLTSYTKALCLNEYWCDFASVLFAQFYNTDGEVSGAGDAILQFKTRRNRRALGESDGRALQEDPGSAGMDITIDVNGEVEGPGDLKTAGGASLGATALASAIAFVGAALLA